MYVSLTSKYGSRALDVYSYSFGLHRIRYFIKRNQITMVEYRSNVRLLLAPALLTSSAPPLLDFGEIYIVCADFPTE